MNFQNIYFEFHLFFGAQSAYQNKLKIKRDEIDRMSWVICDEIESQGCFELLGVALGYTGLLSSTMILIKTTTELHFKETSGQATKLVT